MISPLVLERPGGWRAAGLAACFLPAVGLTVPLLWHAITGQTGSSIGGPFTDAATTSMITAALVGTIALVVGFPAGVLAALYRLPGRSALLALAVLPALIPSLLWAIGWSALTIRSGTWAMEAIDGMAGIVLVLLALAIPIVILTAFVTTRSLAASQVDAARLCGGEGVVLLHALRHAAPATILAAMLAGVLTLSDPGPGMIFGRGTAAAHILTSFSAQYDFVLAGRQSLVLAGIVLLLCVPLIVVAGPRLVEAVMARQLNPVRPIRSTTMTLWGVILLAIILVITLLLPLTGLLLPLLNGVELSRAIDALRRTGANTAYYSFGAGLIAALLGTACALFAGRSPRRRMLVFAAALLVLIQPPALIALGLVALGSSAPPAADVLLRSRLTVCVGLAVRLFPIALLLGMRAWGRMSPSWVHAAAVHGVPLTRYLRRVVVPCLAPSAIAAALLVALLAAADVGTVLLLHPPGRQSLPLNIFTVMANAPESLVASLCLIYIVTATAVLAIALPCLKGRAR